MKNTTTALLVNNPALVSDLTNKALRGHVTKALQAKAGVNKDMWKYAIHMNNIMADELFKDDFGTKRKFAIAMDDNEANLSKYVGAVDVITNKLGVYGYDMTNMTYSNAYILSTVDNLDGFMALHAGTDFSRIGKTQLEKLVSSFKHPEKEAVDVKAKSTDEAGHDETGQEDIEVVEAKKGDITANISGGLLTFTYRKKTYKVPMRDLTAYQVEE